MLYFNGKSLALRMYEAVLSQNVAITGVTPEEFTYFGCRANTSGNHPDKNTIVNFMIDGNPGVGTLYYNRHAINTETLKSTNVSVLRGEMNPANLLLAKVLDANGISYTNDDMRRWLSDDMYARITAPATGDSFDVTFKIYDALDMEPGECTIAFDLASPDLGDLVTSIQSDIFVTRTESGQHTYVLPNVLNAELFDPRILPDMELPPLEAGKRVWELMAGSVNFTSALKKVCDNRDDWSTDAIKSALTGGGLRGDCIIRVGVMSTTPIAYNYASHSPNYIEHDYLTHGVLCDNNDTTVFTYMSGDTEKTTDNLPDIYGAVSLFASTTPSKKGWTIAGSAYYPEFDGAPKP